MSNEFNESNYSSKMDKSIQSLKKDFNAIYYQVISNSMLLNLDFAEVISYMPYKL